MEAGLLKTLGQTLGIGGVALGIFFLLFREMIRKSIFPRLDKSDAFRFLRLISVLIWSIAVIGVGAWIIGDQKARSQQAGISTSGPQSPIVKDTKGNVQIQFGAPAVDSPK
jgi:hypothetical protein